MMQSSWRGDSCGEKASVDAGLSLQLARILAYGIGHAVLGTESYDTSTYRVTVCEHSISIVQLGVIRKPRSARAR